VAPEQRWSLTDTDAKQILFIGRIDRLKGADLIIHAFTHLAATRDKLSLVLVGPDQGLRDDTGRVWNYQDYIQQHVPPDLRPRINWLGQQPRHKLDDLRRRSLVTVVASRYENFPYAALEAMATGCPLVAASVGGLSEIVEDNRNGLKFTGGDWQHLASQLQTLSEHPHRAAELGGQAAEDAYSRYRPQAVAQQTLDYYARTLDRCRAAAGGTR
jgi:glycosyltransferase involved in cell wall biosynthesis